MIPFILLDWNDFLVNGEKLFFALSTMFRTHNVEF